jgi:general secretion pathway protein K
MGDDGEQGFALVSVLWCIALLSLIAAAMLGSGILAARTSHNAWTRLQAQTALDAGVQRAILALLQPGLDADGRVNTVPANFSFDGFAMTLSVQDQAGLIDLNLATRKALQSLLQSQGTALDQAASLADAIIAQRSSGSFQSVDDLNAVGGMTPEIFAGIAPALTVYSHKPDVDTFTAPPAVLQAVTGMTAANADAFVASRAQRANQVRSNAGHVFAIRVQTRAGANVQERQAMVQITNDPARPFWFLDWR